MASPSNYRPARRALLFGLGALGVRVCAFVVVMFSNSSDPMFALSMGAAIPWLSALSFLGTVLAIVGVAYSAIAAHRREWSAVLVVAWTINVAMLLFEPDPFVYIEF